MITQIKEFLENSLLVEFGDGVDYDTHLFQSGLVDSYGFVELVLFLEKTFGIKVNNKELNSGALSTVSSIVKFVKGKQQALREVN